MAPESGTVVRTSCYETGPTGTWYWYAMKEQTSEPVLIRTQEAAPESGETKDSYNIPYQYSGYYIQIVFIGNGDYTGRLEYVSPNMMEGKPLEGNVTISYGDGVTSPRLYNAVMAAYTGADEQNGSWVWYQKGAADPDTAWEVIDGKNYQTSGITSSYIPAEGENGKVIKAAYSAVTPWYQGSVEAETGEIGKAVQNQPDPPSIVQIDGTWIQIADSTSKAGAYGPHPAVVYGCRKDGEAGEINWNAEGEDWFKNLAPNTPYDFYTRYNETSVYQESEVSGASQATTRSGIFTSENLSLSYETPEETKLDVGKILTATYRGEGVSQGVWTIKRSATGEKAVSVDAGETSPPAGCTVSLEPDQEGTGGTAVLTYQLTTADIGNRMIVTFTAKPGGGGLHRLCRTAHRRAGGKACGSAPPESTGDRTASGHGLISQISGVRTGIRHYGSGLHPAAQRQRSMGDAG